jgi:diacylglycerol kinase family enzyme
MKRQLAAIAALLLVSAAVVVAVVTAVQHFPRGVSVLACLLLAIAVGWWALLRRGLARAACAAIALLFLAGAIALIVLEGQLLANLLILAGLALALTAARAVFAGRVSLPAGARPTHPVLFYNPKSGGGKAERFDLATEAHARGIEPIELRRGDHLATIVGEAIGRGADALGMAGGDGSQAVVAAIAAERGLPYVCVPAGTRNHFALDLGVDRNDVVGALDAFTKGGERVVDLAEVNERVFVNNVSLGVYAEAVAQSSYRDAKLRTLADTVPAVLGPKGQALDLHWTRPDGRRYRTSAVVLVSNDPYRLGHTIGSGTRPRLDAGQLGIAVIGSQEDRGAASKRLEQWVAPSFEVGSDRTVAAGIDGEAVQLEPPLRFRTRPKALRALIAPQHPGASPSARMPEGSWDLIRAIASTAVRGRP